MSIVTISWQGGREQSQTKEFEYTGGGGYTIYQSVISLLTAVKDVEEEIIEGRVNEAVRMVKGETILMNQSLNRIHEILGLPKA